MTPRPPARAPRDPRAGGTVVEFAIVLPLFLAMVFGTIDYGWYLYQKFTLMSAIQTGVRSALSVTEDDSPGPWTTARDNAKAALAAGGAIAPASVVWTPTDPTKQLTSTKPTRALTLTGTYTFVPLVGMVKMPSTTLTYTSTMLLDAQNAEL